MGVKITLGQAEAQGADRLQAWCAGWHSLCAHDGEIPLAVALARCGPATRIDDVPRRCSVCGRRGGAVRPWGPRAPGGDGVGGFARPEE